MTRASTRRHAYGPEIHVAKIPDVHEQLPLPGVPPWESRFTVDLRMVADESSVHALLRLVLARQIANIFGSVRTAEHVAAVRSGTFDYIVHGRSAISLREFVQILSRLGVRGTFESAAEGSTDEG